MPHLTLAAAQLGPIARSESRADVVRRLLALLREGHARGCELIIFPEAALTAFFPHWFISDPAEIDAWFEKSMPSPETQPIFDEASRLGVGFCLGYAEATPDGRHYNASVLVERDGRIVGHYRKIHLPGYDSEQPDQPFQNLEKRYFSVGDLGFPVFEAFGTTVGLCICNDRRWPETYRTLALKGAELILLGYNTPLHNPALPCTDALANYHNHLCLTAGAYHNACWVVGAAKAGLEEGVMQIGQSCIVAPSGEIVAMTSTLEDELVVARCDLDLARLYREKLWNFSKNRRPEHYSL